MTEVDGKSKALKIEPIICTAEEMEDLRREYKAKDPKFEGFVQKNLDKD